jgi:hypothetical protein
LLEALGPIARAENEDVAKPAKLVLSRDRAFVREYADALKHEFKTAVADFVSHKAAAEAKPSGRKSLSLVDYGDMEFTTLVESASARVRNAVDDEYTSVKMRVANVVREPDLRDGENPFRPAMFLRAVHQALEKVGVDKADLLRLTACFDAPMIAPISTAYAAVDRHLASQGVSAELMRHSLNRPTIPGGVGNTVPGGWGNSVMGGPRTNVTGGVPTTTGFGPLTTGGMHFAGGVSAEQVLQSLYQRMHLVGPGAMLGGMPAAPLPGVAPLGGGFPAHAPAGAAGQGRYAPAPTVGGTSMYAAQHIARAIPPGVGVGGATAPVAIDANLIHAINEIQRLGALAMTAVQQGRPAPDAAVDVAQVRSRLTETASKQVDKLTIEIVGLLFDRIHDDKHVPPQIKELLLRLQFPLIKVALTDPELFVSREHPARRLIDRIASTSIGWTPEGDENQRYLGQVQRAIHGILAAGEEGMDAYDRALAEFNKYLDEERTRDDDPVARARRALEEAETREVMAIKATIQVRSAFDGLQLESYLREFLLDVWVRVLVAASLREKTDPGLLKKYVGIVPDLVWSVQPKINPEDRKRVVKTIPPVLIALREGMQLIDWPKEKMQEFFARLMSSHANAVKALELAHGVALPSFEASTLRIKLDGLKIGPAAAGKDEAVPEEIHVSDDVVKHVIAENHAPVHHVTEPPLAVGTELPLDDVDIANMIAGWQRGVWFDLQVGQATERVQLRWISPRKTLYLFCTRGGHRSHSLSPETLREYVRSGQLRAVEQAPLFERAVVSVVNELQSAAVQAPAMR